MRFNKHKSSYKSFNCKLYNFIKNNKIDWNNVEIKLIEYLECETNEILCMKEKEYKNLQLNNSFFLNENKAFRTKEEF